MISVGLVGYGYWGPNLLRNLTESKNCEVKFVCERNKERWPSIQRKYHNVTITGDYNDLISDPEIKAVVIATPVSTHYPLAKKAITSKKDIFVEKPLTTKVAQAQHLVDLARENGSIIFVDHTFEYSPPVIKIKEIIDSGEIGEIRYISSSRINLGLFQSDISVICDLAPHDLSVLFYWLNEEPLTVSAVGKAFKRKRVPDVAFINMSFSSGITANLHVSWLSPIKLRRTIIVGSKKMILYDDTALTEKIKIFDSGVDFKDLDDSEISRACYRKGNITSPRVDTYEPLRMAIEHFLECVKLRKTPKTDGMLSLIHI